MRFSYRMVPEVYQVFWAAMARGEFITDAAAEAGTYRKQGTRWLFAAGGVRPRRGRDLKGRCLTLPQREEIGLGRARGESIRAIAETMVGRRRRCRGSCAATPMARAGTGRRRRTRWRIGGRRGRSRRSWSPTRCCVSKVEDDLAKKYSPEQIAGRLKVDFPDQPEMQVSTETIYQSLYVQSRGALKHELTRCLRTGRAVRRPVAEGRAAQEPDPEHDQHRRTSGRGRGPGRARPLGGRS